jgi:hypothetical protein
MSSRRPSPTCPLNTPSIAAASRHTCPHPAPTGVRPLRQRGAKQEVDGSSTKGPHRRAGAATTRAAAEKGAWNTGARMKITVYPLPSRVPLPESPTKGRSLSPSPVPYFGGGEATAPAVRRTPEVNPRPSTPSQHDATESEAPDQKTPTQVNCKFPVRARFPVVATFPFLPTCPSLALPFVFREFVP